MDEIPDVIRVTEERLAKKRSYAVRPMLNVVLLTNNRLLHSTSTENLESNLFSIVKQLIEGTGHGAS